MKTCDVAIVGLGAMGSATAWQLAKRGARVLALEQFSSPHEFGSSHGETRITRLAIGEGDHFTPLATRSHEIWRDIERQTGEELLVQNGCLILSSAGKTSHTHVEGFFENTLAAARRFRIRHEMLDAGAIRARFPRFRIADNEFAYFEPGGGFLRPEACIAAELSLALSAGAEIRSDEKLLSFETSASSVRLTTNKGSYQASQLVLSAGAWLPKLLSGDVAKIFRIYRQVLHWYAIEGAVAPFLPERFPSFIWELSNSAQGIYGFPALREGGGVKIASEEYNTTTDADSVSRTVSPEDAGRLFKTLIAPNIAGLSPRVVRSAACLYTVTADFGFVIDRLPGNDRVLIVSPCSGHGFKHSAAIGENVAELLSTGRSTLDLSPFGLGRFK